MMLLSWCFIVHITNTITIIHDEWIDDFSYDIHGINGWNNDITTNGTLDRYHGWFGGGSTSLPSLYRQFKCSKTSHIFVSFTLYYGCNIEGDDGVKLYFNHNQKLYLRFDDRFNKVFSIHNEAQSNVCETETGLNSVGFKGQNMNYLIDNEIAQALNTFNINFIFKLSAGISNEFEGISNIVIKCQETSFTPTLEPTFNPTHIPTIEPTLNPTFNPTHINIYMFHWWSSSDNWGLKSFIIVVLLCIIIGCVLIVCILAHFGGKKSHSTKHHKKNKFGFGPESLEFSKKQITTQVVIDRYNKNEDKFIMHKNNMITSTRNDNLKIHRTVPSPNIEIKRNTYREYNTIPIKQRLTSSLRSSGSMISSSIASTSTLTSSSSTSSSSSSSCSDSESDETGTSFPTQTATSKTSLSDKEKVEIRNLSDNMTITTTMTVDTMYASDLSQTKTQSDYREYHQLNTLNTKKASKTYKYNYNDDQQLMENDEMPHHEEW